MQTESRVRRITFNFVAAGAAMAEMRGLLLLRDGSFSLFGFVVLHIIITLILVAITLEYKHKKLDARMPFLLTVLVGATGPFGAVMCLFEIYLHSMYMKTATKFSDWFKTLFPDEDTRSDDSVFERLKYGWDDFSSKYQIVPFADVIELGTEDQKRMALSKISRFFKPAFAPALLKAVQDESNAIRVQAATTITKLDHEFSSTIMELEKKLQGNRNHPRIIFDLAKYSDNYAYSGLLDDEREAELRNKAIKYYSEYHKLKPKDDRAIYPLARLHIRREDYEKGLELLKKFIHKNGTIPVNVIPWHMECLFHTQQYEALRECAKINAKHMEKTQDTKHIATYELLTLWANGLQNKTLGDANI